MTMAAMVGDAGKFRRQFPPIIDQDIRTDSRQFGISEQHIVGRLEVPPFIGRDIGRRKVLREFQGLQQLRLRKIEILPNPEELGMQESLTPPLPYAHPL